MQFIDTHCHLDFSSFDNDRLEVINRAKSEGIVRIINPGVSLQSSLAVVKLSKMNKNVAAAIGIHPNNESISLEQITQLENIFEGNVICAIGEIGLDFYRNIHARSEQRKLFLAQLEIARKMNLPVIVHCREAIEDVMAILKDWYQGIKQSSTRIALKPGVLHAFASDIDDAQEAIAHNFYIGIAGPITYKNSKALQKLVELIPLSNILIETDAPFLTPHPYRGKRNEPLYIKYIAEKIAEIKKISVNVVAKQTSFNANQLFI